MFRVFRCLAATLTAAMISVAAGCGGTDHTPARPADQSIAQRALTTALDAWKSGTSREALANQTPKVYVGDEDWSGGFSLTGYQLLDKGEPLGNNLRFNVELQLTPKSGSALQKQVRYVVATDPVWSVTRDDRPE